MDRVKFKSVHELSDKLGTEVAVSDWILIDQDRINQFADATNDRQWIHVDTVRATKESPTRTTIAHGYLTLSLIAGFASETLKFSDVQKVINYGLNKVRFVSMVPVGRRLRARFTVAGLEAAKDLSRQVTWLVTVECEGEERPACVAEILFRYYS